MLFKITQHTPHTILLSLLLHHMSVVYSDYSSIVSQGAIVQHLLCVWNIYRVLSPHTLMTIERSRDGCLKSVIVVLCDDSNRTPLDNRTHLCLASGSVCVSVGKVRWEVITLVFSAVSQQGPRVAGQCQQQLYGILTQQSRTTNGLESSTLVLMSSPVAFNNCLPTKFHENYLFMLLKKGTTASHMQSTAGIRF